MFRRRTILTTAALALTVIDSWWFYEHFVALNANITYVGLDSLVMGFPAEEHAPRLIGGKWEVDPTDLGKAITSDIASAPHQEIITLVSIAPEQTLGKAVAVIRDLKSRHFCNVFIKENLEPRAGASTNHDFFIPGFVLCGHSIGDAGFFGTLPVDRRVHVGQIE